jgi:hypothetical protein
MILPYGIFDK